MDKGKVLGCLVSTKGIEANPDPTLKHEGSTISQGCAKTNRQNSNSEQIHSTFSRPKLTIFQNPPEPQQARAKSRKRYFKNSKIT
jgi:hypothetical protein